MEKSPIIAENALPGLLERFYGRVRRDAELGPVFEDAVSDWPRHLDKLADFWSSVMLHSRRYHGNPMALHLKHAQRIMPAMFERWLTLWKRTTDELLSPEAAAEMQLKAARIAESLQLGLRFQPAAPQWLPPEKPAADGVSRPYRSSPIFDAENLPAVLRRAHSTKPGVWGVIRVLEGTVRYCIEDGSVPPVLLTQATPGLINPEQPHHVEPVGAMRLQVDFYDHKPAIDI